MIYKLIRPILFSLPPEASHRLGMAALKFAGPLLPISAANPKLARKILGLTFPNPVGLAAGFDKYAEAAPWWIRLGFGFAELGTFTRHAQPGNGRPRVWRYAGAQALVNRFGFNNPGSEAAAARLRALKDSGRWPGHPLGINLGKSKVTPVEEAEGDYLYSLRQFKGLADYFAVNVSSPNTPGLRSLQAAKPIKKIVAALSGELRGWHGGGAVPRRYANSIPLFVKFAPDLSDKNLLASCDAALSAGAQGLILTNTTLSREGLGTGPHPDGGMSGAPLTERADAALALVAKHTRGRVPLIGVGGVMTPADARRKLELGASLVQIYTGFIYQGPSFPARICNELAFK